jgi:hypothetical protein
MRLLELQLALGRSVLAPVSQAWSEPTLGREDRAQLSRLVGSDGFRFTRHMQRSWCRGRTASVARLTLSTLPIEEGRRLVDHWVDAGGGTASHISGEAEAFLEFIARSLADPSHALSVCRMEQAAYRASEAAMHFRPPDLGLLDDPAAMLWAGKGAALVQFFAEPQQLLGALEAGEPLPPLSDQPFPVLFAPGLPRMFRAASDDEAALWAKFANPVDPRTLVRDGCARHVIEEMFIVGAVEPAAGQQECVAGDLP